MLTVVYMIARESENAALCTYCVSTDIKAPWGIARRCNRGVLAYE